MPNKMLIDASHPEETRVVVVHGSRIEEFDFESQDKKQLRGNIYLARVTRVEPSLQAAFVEYGGNRHGFLAFSEIHPDYYQIPVADRQALLKAEAEENWNDDEDEGNSKSSGNRNNNRRRRGGHKADASNEANGTSETAEASETVETDETVDASAEQPTDDAATQPNDTVVTSDENTSNDDNSSDEPSGDTESNGPAMAAAVTGDVVTEEVADVEAVSDTAAADADDADKTNGNGDDDAGDIDTIGSEDALEEVQSRRPSRRQYKIQEVIKRRQILLVQVVKEERGNKGAALTTYLSLAGRYSVLMPNTARGGGISRKITNVQDRKRLKEVVKDLEVPQGMGVILRTAGESRTKPEIKRDYDYLMRMWESVRTLTLKSVAPALVYEEGSLIKRAVRDLYNKDINQIQVAGEEAYREAKDFMRMLMPSHAKVVQPYRDQQPVFARNGIESQLDKILQPQVTLKSGGYIIINQTEALVAVDVNSGRSTKEHSIEDTALQTNLEAAEEVARQLRLRDLAGLIVIDFIDMEEGRNNRAVEKRMKDCLKNDRARIQVGRISHFGLLEMSRQRIRSSVLESTMQPCPHCSGTGQIRSDSSLALLVMRSIEEYLLKDSRNDIHVRTAPSTALYLLNQKRQSLIELENRFGVSIFIETDDKLGHQHYLINKGEPSTRPTPVFVQPAQIMPEDDDDIIIDDEDETVEAQADSQNAATDEAQNGAENGAAEGEDGNGGRKRRRKRRRRGGRDRNGANQQASEHEGGDENGDDNDDASDSTSGDEAAATVDAETVSEASTEAEVVATTEDASAAKEEHAERSRRQRGRRGGRRTRTESDATAEAQPEAVEAATTSEPVPAVETVEAAAPAVEVVAPEAPAADVVAETATEEKPTVEAVAEAEALVVEEKPKAKPRRPRVKKAAPKAAEAETGDEAPAPKAPTRARTTRAAKAKAVAVEETATPAPAPATKVAVAETPVVEAAPVKAAPVVAAPEPVAVEAPKPVEVATAPAAEEDKPAPRSRRKADVAETPTEPVVSSSEPAEAAPRKSGWWQRKSFF